MNLYTGRVQKIVDGDTIDIFVNGKKERIRLIGMDCPETEFDYEGQELQAEEATRTAINELLNKTVSIELDVVEADPYGRIQAWIFLKDELFNKTIVEKGEAYLDTFIPNVMYQDELVEAQETARENKAGLWAVDFFDQPPEEEFGLDLTNTNLEIDVPFIDETTPEEFVMHRRDGLGASDIPIVLGANPYQTAQELFETKLAPHVTQKELEISEKPAVRKGRELENLIVKRLKEYFNQSVWKPRHQFRIKEYPFLKINYDGVTGNYEQYIPIEIKVITYFGEKNYDFNKAYFVQDKGFRTPPENVPTEELPIAAKAEHSGIPPMYYVQLQLQMLGFGANHGYLATLAEKDWLIRIFYIPQDESVQNKIIIHGYKFWQSILKAQHLDYDTWAKRKEVV